MEKVILKWTGGQQFSLEGKGTLDALDPKTLMLASMGKCAGIVAVMLMEKMRVDLKSFTVEADGVLKQDGEFSALAFVSFTEVFRVECDPADAEKVRNAVDKTVNKYCGVTLMFKKIAPVNHSVIINEKG